MSDPLLLGSLLGYFNICVGLMACNTATTENCSIALGDHVEFHGSHRLATKNGEVSLTFIDEQIARLIDSEIQRVLGQPNATIDRRYIDLMNEKCFGKPST